MELSRLHILVDMVRSEPDALKRFELLGVVHRELLALMAVASRERGLAAVASMQSLPKTRTHIHNTLGISKSRYYELVKLAKEKVEQ